MGHALFERRLNFLKALGCLGEARASGEACASRLDMLDDVRLDVRREGPTLVFSPVFPDGTVTCALDMVIRLPAGLPVVVRDGSGPITVTGTATS